jgi:Uma2 family endonuclease
MTATPALTFSTTRHKKYTADDYDRLTPANSGNYELHNGKIIYMASPLIPHQRLAGKLFNRLFNFVDNNQLGEAFIAPLDVYFSIHEVNQPDILFISNERSHIIEDNRKVKGAPDLVVEILSEGNTPKEMAHKKQVFESHNVREYWLIDLKKRHLKLYQNTHEGFIEVKTFEADEIFSSILLNGFTVNLGLIF